MLSKDGGHTWDPASTHLVAPINPTQGGWDDDSLVTIKDWNVTAATWDNGQGNHDVFVVWATGQQSSTLATTVTYDSAGQGITTTTPIPLFLNTEGHDLSLVAGTHPLIGNFVFLMAPGLKSVGPTQCPNAEGKGPFTETWRTFFSANAPVGQQWFTGHGLSGQTWKCAGGAHDTASSIYPVNERPAVAYDVPATDVIAATTRIRPNDVSRSLAVRIAAFG